MSTSVFKMDQQLPVVTYVDQWGWRCDQCGGAGEAHKSEASAREHYERHALACSTPSERRVYTTAEAAEALGVTERHVYNLIKRGELPVVRLGRATRIPLVALERMVEKAMTP